MSRLLKIYNTYKYSFKLYAHFFIAFNNHFISGPPLITLSQGSMNSFSLLPPQMNRADVNLLTQDVILSTNLVGRWQKPDDSFVTDGTLTFPIFAEYDEGLYKFYVTNWDGDNTLAIQIYISVIG